MGQDTQTQRFSRPTVAGWSFTVCSSLDPGYLFSSTEHMQIDNRPVLLNEIKRYEPVYKH